MTPDEREQFEAWYRNEWPVSSQSSLRWRPNNDYFDFHASGSWDAWQASRATQSARIAALEAALRNFLDCYPEDCREDEVFVAGSAALAGDAP